MGLGHPGPHQPELWPPPSPVHRGCGLTPWADLGTRAEAGHSPDGLFPGSPLRGPGPPPPGSPPCSRLVPRASVCPQVFPGRWLQTGVPSSSSSAPAAGSLLRVTFSPRSPPALHLGAPRGAGPSPSCQAAPGLGGRGDGPAGRHLHFSLSVYMRLVQPMPPSCPQYGGPGSPGRPFLPGLALGPVASPPIVVLGPSTTGHLPGPPARDSDPALERGQVGGGSGVTCP